MHTPWSEDRNPFASLSDEDEKRIVEMHAQQLSQIESDIAPEGGIGL